jgi:hypothetical protein
MKKILLILTIFSMVFTSCEPLEDINAEVDAQANPIVGDVVFTMSDDDYEVVDKSYGNFNSETEAKELIPSLLTSKYPVWGNKSSATVTFNLYNKKYDEKSLESYTVSSQDYADGGHSYGNFSKASHLTDFLDLKFPDAENRLLVSLTYKYYSGSVSTLNNGFLYVNGEWEMVTGFTDDEYTAMGEGYPNFSSDDEAYAKIPVFLLDKYKYDVKEAGVIEGYMYKVYVGGGVTESYVAYFIYDGISWSEYSNNIEETIQFGHDGETWVPDNTIKYSLVVEDYATIGASTILEADTEDDFTNALGNLNNFKNFNRSGSSSAWSDRMMIKAMAVFLDSFAPTAADGQKYVLTVSTYGPTPTETFSLIKEAGAWKENK